MNLPMVAVAISVALHATPPLRAQSYTVERGARPGFSGKLARLEIAWDSRYSSSRLNAMTNSTRGFIRSEEAGQFIQSITDPVTKILVNNAHYHLYRRLAEKRLPEGEFDMRFYVEVMRRCSASMT